MEQEVEQVEVNENEIVVTNLADFIQKVTEIRNTIRNNEGTNPDSQRLFFRGQLSKNWNVQPGVFRQSSLGFESDMVNAAYLRNPTEFRALPTDFERLAKLQHYGLPTRLLDVTSNPLVALYFACQTDSKAPNEDGVVFFKRSYCKSYTDLEVAVISHLAIKKSRSKVSLEDLLQELENCQIYTPKAADDCRKNRYKSLLNILQNNYFVISNFNNERLNRQSGSFLLAGNYNILPNTSNVGASIIKPAVSNLRCEFEQEQFVIPCEAKGQILDELDICNINEGSLFPELEHQMAYIKQGQSKKSTTNDEEFYKIDDLPVPEEETLWLAKEPSEEEISQIVDTVLQESINPLIWDDCKTAIMDNISVDWYKRESVLSKMRLDYADALRKNGMDVVHAKHAAKDAISKLLTQITNAEHNK